MHLRFVIVLCLLLTISATSALELKEKIKIKGGGSMSISTHAINAEDMAEGTGIQDYERYVKMNDVDSESLDFKVHNLSGRIFEEYPHGGDSR